MSNTEQQTKPDGGASELMDGLGAWLPIDTAPRDGTEIIAAWRRNDKTWAVGAVAWVVDRYWALPGRNYTGWWLDARPGCAVPYQDPEYWQPLPEAPNAKPAGEGPQGRSPG